MSDILHDFPIRASLREVFDAVSLPHQLDQWWTQRCRGTPGPGADYELWFGPEYDWRAIIETFDPPAALEYRMTRADPEWLGTRIGFHLQQSGETTQIRFRHTGWSQESEHFRISTFCWAMYLRILRRYLEHGEQVPYELRLDV